MTEVKHGQTKEKAGEIRLKHHLQHPLQCLSGAVVESFQLDPVGHVMTKGNCLLQEAINAAFAMGLDGAARGACYSCEKIGPFLRNSAGQVRKAVGKLTGQAARDALKDYVSTLGDDHPLSRHVAGLPYKDQEKRELALPTKYRRSVSGKCGCKTRKMQLSRREYKHGSAKHRRLQRGVARCK